DDIVSYTTSGGAAHEFDALEFLMLLSSHIPKPYESIICYYGYYSCRARGERRGYAPEGEAFSAQQLERAPSRASFSQLKPAKAQLTDVFNDGRRVIDFPNLR